jgi:hypothetical protein
LRPTLEREPWLVGSLTYRWDVARTSDVEVGGDLASVAAASCIKGALAKATLDPRASGTIHYDLEVRGTYVARALDDALRLDVEVVGLDPSGPAASPPRSATEDLAGTREKLRRCAFGAAPALERPEWIVLGVGADGAATVATPDTGLLAQEASSCMRRTLSQVRFPTEGRPYGLSLVIGPEADARSVPPPDVQEAGMIGLLGTSPGGHQLDPSMFGVLGSSDAIGVGGLGLRGTGEGGGGRGEGIGLGPIGTIGQGANTGPGLGAGARTAPPKVRVGPVTVGPKYPPEIIQRVVRRNFGRYRLCYEQGLRKDPKLAGKVIVSFAIAADGSVKDVTRTTTLSDEGVATCVAKAFGDLSFPKPDGGVIKVSYPLIFASADDASSTASPEPAAPPPPPTVGGTRVATLTTSQLEERLKSAGLPFVRVPGAIEGFFVRAGSSVLAVLLTEDGHPGAALLTTCKTSDERRALIVRGPRCERLMSRLVD